MSRSSHWGRRLYWAWYDRKNIFCQKIFNNSSSFQVTEMVLTSKWGRIKPGIQIWPDQFVAGSWTVVGSPKHAEKMLMQLRLPTGLSLPAVQYQTPPTCLVYKVWIPPVRRLTSWWRNSASRGRWGPTHYTTPYTAYLHQQSHLTPTHTSTWHLALRRPRGEIKI